MKAKLILCFTLIAQLVAVRANAQCLPPPPPPTVVSPVFYCQDAIAVPLSATGSNLLWGNEVPGVAGGTGKITTTNTYIDGSYSNRKLNFTSTKPNVKITAVNFYILPFQQVTNLKLSIYNSAGTIIGTSSTTTSRTALFSAITITSIFDCTLATAGNYSIGVSSGTGNIGSNIPTYPITEPTGTMDITGGASGGIRCFNKIKFIATPSPTAPVPATDDEGSFNYTVTQTVGGCVSAPATITVIVNEAPAATIDYAGSPYCSSLSDDIPVTREGTAGGVYAAAAGLSINSSTGTIKPGLSTPGTYTVSYTMTGTGGCANVVTTASVAITASPIVTILKTETCLGSNTGTITASASGNIGPYTYSLNGATYQSSGNFTGLAAGYYNVAVKGSTVCVTSTNVTIVAPATSTDDQNAAGTDAWIGHMYDGISFNNYQGQFSEPEVFDESFVGNTTCFNVTSAGSTRSIYTETFSTKLRMNSSKKGLYVVQLGSDDGARLTVDGVMVFNNWTDHAFNFNNNVLLNLTGSSNLLYEFYENSGANRVVFQSFTPIISNNLTTNTSQSLCIGTGAVAISGDVFASLPAGVTLSSSGYQWVYSTSPGGSRTNIAGATGATFTPSTAAAPFNSAGTYYVYRIAKLSSTNNINPNPYVASLESNAAVIIIIGGAQWTGSVSTDWSLGGNWCAGLAPTSSVDVIIKSSAARMPEIITTGSCKSLTIEAGAALSTLSSGTINIAGTLTNSGTMTNSGTVNFNGTQQQTFSGINSFYNLSISNTGGVVLPSAITVNNNLLITSGILNSNNYNLVVKGNWTNNASTNAFSSGTGTVSFTGNTAQIIGGSFSIRFNHLTIANTLSSVSLNANVVIQGNLNVSSGNFDLASFTANRETAGGTLMVANGATLRIGGTNTFPANFGTNTLVVASTTEYYGTNQTVANKVYGNLVLSSSSGAAVKTMPATALTVLGSLSSIKGAGTSVSYTAAAPITVNGLMSIGAATTFNGGSFAHSMGASWINDGTFNGNTGTITFTGTSSNISGSGNQNFNNLTIAASLISFANNIISLSGNLATTGSGSFSPPAGGTLTMTGTGKTISGFGISIHNLTVTGSVSTAATFQVTGDLAVAGSFTSSAGMITMSGAAKTISGTGAKNFASLYITGAASTNADFTISSALNVAGSFNASAGTATFTGTSTLTGKASLFNVVVNGTSLTLSAISTLGIANAMTITAGTINVTTSTPNTVDFNGTGAQNINAIAYNNLTLSNGNTKTAIAGLTVNNNLTIASTTNFTAGNFTHTIYGDWFNNGTFTAAAGTVQFMGSRNANIYGATTFNTLAVNNSNATVAVNMQANVNANVVNMISGMILTGENTLTITSDRTGPGIILGRITRTQVFATNVDYAFEGPDNTVRFASVSSVNSITVKVSLGSVTDFPFNAAIGRIYDIAIPSGTYTAKLRLHYQDAELNGNNEADISMWNFNGTAWLPAAKSASSSTDNYVEQAGLTSITNKWTLGFSGSVAEWTGVVSTDWNTAGNWNVLQGSASRPPAPDDVAVFGYSSFTRQPTISSAVSVKNIVIGSAKPLVLSMATGGSLQTGDIIGLWPGNAEHTINVNDQTINIAGNLALSDGAASHIINLNIGSGNLNVAGSLMQSGNASVTFTGSGNLSISDNYQHQSGSFTPGTGTVTYNGNMNQTIASVDYHHLKINNNASTVFINDSTHISGNLSVITGDLENNAIAAVVGNVNISSGAIMDNLGVLRVGGDWNNNGTYTSRAEGTNVIFEGAGTQHISATTFHDLEINKPVGSVAELIGDVVLNGDLIGNSGTLDTKSFFFNRDVVGGFAKIADAGTLIIGANNAPNKFSSYLLGAGSTVIFSGIAAQHLMLPGVVYGNIVFRNAGPKILYTPIEVLSNLTIESGATFNGGTNAITLRGNWINNGTYEPATSTLFCLGTGKTISGNTDFYRLTVSGTYTMLNNNSVNDLLRITSTGSLSGGPGVMTTMNGSLINNGILYTLGTTTFTGMKEQTLSLINAVQTVAVTVNFNGSVPPVLNSTSAPQFGFLNINNTGGLSASVGYDILYGLSVGAGASFHAGLSTHNLYGYLSNNGTITSSGTINFTPATAAAINLGTNFSSTGRVVFGGAGKITTGGTPLSLANVTISNTNVDGVAGSSNWTLTKNLNVSAGSVFNAGSFQYFVAGIIDNKGTINAGNSTFTLNGTLPQTIYSTSPFNKLEIATVSNPVTLLSDVTVNNTLHFTTGNINTESYKLIQPDKGIVTNASQNTGWVNGYLKKGIAFSAAAREFETGDANFYAPLSLNLQAVTAGGSLSVSTTAGDHPLLSESRISLVKSVNRYWKLVNDGIQFSTAEATFKHPFSDVDAGANTASFGASIYNGATWKIAEISASNDTITTVLTDKLAGEFALGDVCNKNTSIAYAAEHFCNDAPAATPVITGNAAGVFSAEEGLSINAATGEITFSTSTPAEYKVFYTIAGTSECAAFVTSFVVHIEPAAVVDFSYAGTEHCTGEGIIYPEFTGTTGGVYSANGGLFIDPLTGAIDLRNNVPGNYIIMYSIPASDGCTALDFTTALQVLEPGTWTGAVSTSWFNPGNWMCDMLPEEGVSISLSAGATHYPVIDYGSVTLHNLTVESGASLTISNAVLKLTGEIANSGTIDAANGTLDMAGTVPQIILPNSFKNNAVASLHISNTSSVGVVLTTPLDVYESLTYAGPGTSFVTNDFLTLKSSSAGSARVGDMTGVKMTGNVTVENYVNRRSWHFLAVPTNGSQTILQSWQEGSSTAGSNPAPGFGAQLASNRASWLADGFDCVSYTPALKKYSTVTKGWVPVLNTNATNIKSVDGYMVFLVGDRSITPASQATGPTVLRTKGLLYSGNLPAIPVGPSQMISVGNPYAAPIDLRKLTKTGVKDFFYVWDPVLGGQYGLGGYQLFSLDGGGNYVVTPGGGSYGASGTVSNYIRSGLAFFVEGDETGGSIQFTEHAKYDPLDPPISAPQQARLMINLLSQNTDSSTAMTDGLLVKIDDAFSNGIDKGDAFKYANSGENISILNGTKTLMVEKRNLQAAKDTIYINLANVKLRNYVLSISAEELNAGGRTGTLIDNFTGSRTMLQLNGTTALNFAITNAAGSYASNRFKIVFDRMNVLPVKFVALKAYSVANNAIHVDWKTQDETNAKYYDVERSHDAVNFVKINSTAARGNNSFYSLNDAQPLADVNYYRVKCTEQSGDVYYSNIVKVNMGNKAGSVSIFPNPVTDDVTSLQLNNMPVGKYVVRLVNLAGQTLYVNNFENAGRNSAFTMYFDKNITSGLYQVTITDPEGIKHNRQLLVK